MFLFRGKDNVENFIGLAPGGFVDPYWQLAISSESFRDKLTEGCVKKKTMGCSKKGEKRRGEFSLTFEIRKSGMKLGTSVL